jgi:hypothetical protein
MIAARFFYSVYIVVFNNLKDAIPARNKKLPAVVAINYRTRYRSSLSWAIQACTQPKIMGIEQQYNGS